MKTTVYGLAHCGTCKKAIAHLERNGITYDFIDIRESPPSKSLISKALSSGIEPKRFLNTSGQLYRSGGYKNKVASYSKEDLAKELSENPMLIKRPFLQRSDKFLVGYKEDEYDSL